MKTKREIKSLGQKVVESAKNVDWTNVSKLKKITKNIHYLQRSIELIDKYPTDIDLLFLKAQLIASNSKSDKITIECIDYIVS